jgi:uncharacterized membrane protein YjjP (DUF1212 family)
MTTALVLGVVAGTGAAAYQWRAVSDVLRLLPAILASSLLGSLFASLIWPVLPLIWPIAPHEAIAGFIASLLPGLVGWYADPDAPLGESVRGVLLGACAVILGLYILVPIFSAM